MLFLSTFSVNKAKFGLEIGVIKNARQVSFEDLLYYLNYSFAQY